MDSQSALPKKTVSNLVVILLLTFCFPIGLIFMWTSTNWSKANKYVVTGIFGILMLISELSPKTPDRSNVSSASSSPSQAANFAPTESDQKPIPKIKPNIVDEEMSTIGNIGYLRASTQNVVPVTDSQQSYDALRKAVIANDTVGINDLASEGHYADEASDTPALLIDVHFLGEDEVRLKAGPDKDKIVFVDPSFVRTQKNDP